MISQLNHKATILLTRPRADAEVFAAELAGLGIAAVIDPVIDIAAEKALDQDLSRFQAVLVTSANAVEALAALSNVRGVPLVTVGVETCSSAEIAGFENVRLGGRTAAELCAWVKDHLQPGDGPILYASGADISRDLDTDLPAYDLVREVVYRAVLSPALTGETIADLSSGQIDAVVHFSARSAGHFASLCAEADIIPAMTGVLAYCISENVARTASESVVWRELRVAESPSRGDILKRIASDLERGELP